MDAHAFPFASPLAQGVSTGIILFQLELLKQGNYWTGGLVMSSTLISK